MKTNCLHPQPILRRRVWFTLAVAVLLVGTTAARAQFGTVINIPPDPNIGDHGGIGSGTQLNLKGSGTIGKFFDAGSPLGTSTNVEVNVQGGLVGAEYHANGGSVTNITAGSVGIDLDANALSIVNVMGGNVGSGLDALSGSTLHISGGSVGSAMDAFDADVFITGGNVGNDFHIFNDSVVNMSGGHVGYFLQSGGSDQTSTNVIVNISGGRVDGGVDVNNGSTFTTTGGLIGAGVSTYGIIFHAFALGLIHGGIVDYDFDTLEDSDVRLFGGDFYLDDTPLAASGQKITIPSGSVLSGVLADGTPIMLSDTLGDDTFPQTISLHSATLPPPSPTNYVVPTDTPPPSIGNGQTLTLNNGGVVGDFFRGGRGSTLVVNGGQIGRDTEVFGATVNISGGQVFSDFAAMEASTVTISGGVVGDYFDAGRGTVVTLSGGSLGTGTRALAGSQFNITGGMVRSFFSAQSGSVVNISGGALGSSFGANSGSAVTLNGGEFRLDGVLVAGLDTPGSSVPINIPSGSVLSGTLADGTPIALSSAASDFISNGTLTLHAVTLPAIGPAVINVPGATAPLGIRQGQTLVVAPGGVVGTSGSAFNAGAGSAISMSGGEINPTIRAVGATVNVAGGIVHGIQAFDGSVIGISGNSTAFGISAYAGSEITVAGGNVSGIEAFSGSSVNIEGGTFAGNSFQRAFAANVGSDVDVAGGMFNGRFGAFGAVVNVSGGHFGDFEASGTGTEVHLFGSEFLLNGVPIAGLVLDQAMTINDRNVTLSGILADGAAFSFVLNSSIMFGTDYFLPNVLLTVTRVDSHLLAGDYNDDGKVDAADYTVWRDKLGMSFTLLNETSSPGMVDSEDYNAWKANFGAMRGGGSLGNAPVPEPATLTLVLGALVLGSVAARSRS